MYGRMDDTVKWRSLEWKWVDVENELIQMMKVMHLALLKSSLKLKVLQNTENRKTPPAFAKI